MRVDRRANAFVGFACLITAWLGHQPALSAMPSYLHADEIPVGKTDRSCGPYAIWHAARYFSTSRPIAEIVRETGASGGTGVSVRTMIDTLNRYGVRAELVSFDPDELTRIDVPFISLSMENDGSIGHCEFCVPFGNGAISVFNRGNPPVILTAGLLTSAEKFPKVGHRAMPSCYVRQRAAALGRSRCSRSGLFWPGRRSYFRNAGQRLVPCQRRFYEADIRISVDGCGLGRRG